MLIDLFPQGQWEKANEALGRQLQLPEQEYLRVGSNLAAQVLEACLGFLHQYGHRRQIALLKGNSYVLDPVHSYFLKEGVSVQSFDAGKVKSVDELLAQLKPDLCFLAFVEDHPVTGEIFSLGDELAKALAQKKIPFLRISHHRHRLGSRPVEPFEYRLCGAGSWGSFAVFPTRWKSVPSLFHPLQPWTEKRVEGLLKANQRKAEFKTEVQEFEKKCEQFHFCPWFAEGTPRLWDRSVVISESFHGDFFLQSLCQRLNLSRANPGFEAGLETTNLSRWGGYNPYSSWWNTQEDLAGLLILSAETILRKDFLSAFESTVKELTVQLS